MLRRELAWYVFAQKGSHSRCSWCGGAGGGGRAAGRERLAVGDVLPSTCTSLGRGGLRRAGGAALPLRGVGVE